MLEIISSWLSGSQRRAEESTPGPTEDIWYQSVSSGVNGMTALQVTAVWACINRLSGDIGKLPLNVYRRTANGREKARDHYLYKVLRHEANRYMTALRFKRLMMTWLLLEGNAYAELETNGRGQVLALWPWRPDLVKIEDSDAGPVYVYTPGNREPTRRPWHEMLHLRGLEWDGLKGMNPITTARHTISLAMSAEEFAEKFYSNGARPGGILTVPGGEAKNKDALRKEWNRVFGGASNAHKTAVFIEGTKYEPLGIKQQDAEYIATRKMSVEDICRLFGMTPHKIASLDRATFNNIEELNLDYVSGTLGDHMANFEQEVMFSCLSDDERKSVYVEFEPDALLRGRFRDRVEGVGVLVDKGIFDRDEARELFNRNSRGGKAGELTVQSQMIPLDKAGEVTQPSKPPAEPEDDGDETAEE